MIKEMDVWYLSTLFVWSQFVLAKNLPKGEIVEYLCIGFIIAKTNTLVRCWICCSNIFTSCTMLDIMFQHHGTIQCALFICLVVHALYLIKESTPYFLLAKQRVFVQNQLEDLFLKYRQYFRNL